MSIKFQCPACQQVYTAPDKMAGATTKCKKCGITMAIPAAVAAPSPPAPSPLGSTGNLADLLDEASLPSSAPPPGPAPNVAPASPKTLWGEGQTSKRARKCDAVPSERRTNIAIVLLVAGGFALYFGYREWKLSSLAKSAPQRISMADLAARGPGDNIWVDLTDVRLVLEQTVVETKNGRTNYAWIPAVPAGDVGAFAPGGKRVVVGTNRAGDDQLRDLVHQTTLRGMIVNATDSLGSEERKLLNEGMPGVDAGSCYFLRIGKEPTSSAVHSALLGGGALSLLVGLVLAAFEIRARMFGRSKE